MRAETCEYDIIFAFFPAKKAVNNHPSNSNKHKIDFIDSIFLEDGLILYKFTEYAREASVEVRDSKKRFASGRGWGNRLRACT